MESQPREESPRTTAAKDAAKRDIGYLLSVLRIQGGRSSDLHAPCPICRDTTCLQYGIGDDSHAFWKCHKGCGGGDIFAALKAVDGIGYSEALKQVKLKYGDGKSDYKVYEKHNASRNGTHKSEKYERAPKAEPVLDLKRAEEFIERHHEYLIKHPGIRTHYKRGLNDAVIKKYRIGFVENVRVKFAPWAQHGLLIPAAWCIPITDADGKLKSVRFHFEVKLENCGKVMSAPFGTVPPYVKEEKDAEGKIIIQESKPVHAYYGMWPHPATLKRSMDAESFSMDAAWWISRIPPKHKPEFDHLAEEKRLIMEGDKVTKGAKGSAVPLTASESYRAMEQAWADLRGKLMPIITGSQSTRSDYSSYVFIIPGELKVLAALSAGLNATGPTGGEAWMPGPEWLRHFAGRHVILVYDDDPPKLIETMVGGETKKKVVCAGPEWAKKWAIALLEHGAAKVMAVSGGRRQKV